MRLQMVDRQKRLVWDQRQGFSGRQPDNHPADQTGACSGGNAVEIFEGHLRPRHGAADQAVEGCHMGARGNFGHHAAIGSVFFDLAENLVGENMPAPVTLQRHDAGRSFITGGFDPKNNHALSTIMRFSLHNPITGQLFIRFPVLALLFCPIKPECYSL